jgi:valyl-tRNA synthetase
MQASYPEPEGNRCDEKAEHEMDLIMQVVNGIRNIRGEMNVLPATRVEAVCLCAAEETKVLLYEHIGTVTDLARLSKLQVLEAGDKKPKLAAGTLVSGIEVYVVLKDILDFDSEVKRLQKEISKLEKEWSFTQKKLSNEDFLGRAPSEVIEKEREKAARLGEKMEKLKHHLQVINEIRESASAGE